MSLVSSSVALTAANLKSVPSRFGSSLVAVIAFAGVALILTAVLSLRESLQRSYEQSGRDDVAVVLSGGTNWETLSTIAHERLLQALRESGIDVDPHSDVSPEFVSNSVRVPLQSGGLGPFVTGRGVTPAAEALRAGFRIVDGRHFTPGLHEAIVGRALARYYPALRVGSTVEVGSASLTVVGLFEASTSTAEFEAWMDKSTFQALTYGDAGESSIAARLSSSVRLRLSPALGIARIEAALESLADDERGPDIRVVSERDLLRLQSANLIDRLGRAAAFIAVAMGFGAVFGAVNTMYSAIAVRMREIATLRAMGFLGVAIGASIVAEAMLLAVVGGLVGGLMSAAIFGRYLFSSFNPGANAAVTLGFDIGPGTIGTVLAYVLALSILSSIFPCVRALRQPVARGLAGR